MVWSPVSPLGWVLFAVLTILLIVGVTMTTS
jgi:hypothetical protein